MTEIESLLAAAHAAEAGSRERAIALYGEALKRDRACLAAHNALERLAAPDAYGRWMRIDCTIDERDDIFRYFARHPLSANPLREYLSDGWRTLSELMVLLERHDRPLLKIGSMLEFAAGFGRFTRHLAPLLPGRLACSDVVPGSVDFLRERFGVEAFASSLDPAEVRWPSRYELVFVLSLFTHLNPARWGAWLQCLARAVEPGGLLVFTTHSEECLEDPGLHVDADGAAFIPSSESTALEAQDYGTTFTPRARVEREVALALPGAKADLHPRVFWLAQDAMVVRC